jgi:hypothetical protein
LLNGIDSGCAMSVALNITGSMTTHTYRNGQMIEIPETVVAEASRFVRRSAILSSSGPGVDVTTLASITGTVRVMTVAALERGVQFPEL